MHNDKHLLQTLFLRFDMAGTKKRIVVGLFLILAGGVALGADAGKAASLGKPKYLPEAARDLLRERMERHGDDMMVLMASVLMLQYELAGNQALNIAREPKLVRAGTQDFDTLNALLPARFFDLQDQLSVRARELSEAAKSHDDAKVVKAFANLTETCVACHATYFRGPETSAPKP